MLKVEFEPTIPASEQTKTVHALDRAAAVMTVMASLPSGLTLPSSELGSLVSS
jgi:hypothetical protein